MKIVHFTSKIVFGNFLDIWRFFSGHTAHDRPIVRFISTFLFKIGDENSKNLALAVTHWSSGCFRLWKSVVRIQRMAHLIYCSTMLKSQKEENGVLIRTLSILYWRQFFRHWVMIIAWGTSTGLVVMGGGSCLKSCKFKSRQRKLLQNYLLLNCNDVLKRKKEPGIIENCLNQYTMVIWLIS